MEQWRDRLALVTGASGQGLKVVSWARPVSNIEELAAKCKSIGYPRTLIPHRCDLSSEEDILSTFLAVCSQHSGVDICINNAGLAWPDTLLSGNTSSWKDMFNVNMLALSICTREAYQSMKEWKVDDGHIININSMSGHQVSPHSVIHFYSATKYAITTLTEGLRQELQECISPEVAETQFSFKLHNKDPEKAAAIYECIKCLKPEDVAEAVIYVLKHPSTCPGESGLDCPSPGRAQPSQRRTAGRPSGWGEHPVCLKPCAFQQIGDIQMRPTE
uniref:Dehydrogenase/reductase SDR family member 11 n=1 Tax=Lynx canadensis TaxID=61383 RepID=A0A667HS27_LYNCA